MVPTPSVILFLEATNACQQQILMLVRWQRRNLLTWRVNMTCMTTALFLEVNMLRHHGHPFNGDGIARSGNNDAVVAAVGITRMQSTAAWVAARWADSLG